jgi:hypothetical protein
MKTLEVQNFVSGSVQIAECEWDWTEDRSKASFISKEGVCRTIRLPEGFFYQPSTIAHLVGTDCIIAVHRTGRLAWQLCPQTGAIREAAALSGRDALDQGLMHHRFEAARDRLLLLYEGGVIAFGASGNMTWRHEHTMLDWQTEVSADGNVVVELPLGTKWQYDCFDGAKTNLPPEPPPDSPSSAPRG